MDSKSVSTNVSIRRFSSLEVDPDLDLYFFPAHFFVGIFGVLNSR